MQTWVPYFLGWFVESTTGEKEMRRLNQKGPGSCLRARFQNIASLI
jgi:hypothetical protein